MEQKNKKKKINKLVKKVKIKTKSKNANTKNLKNKSANTANSKNKNITHSKESFVKNPKVIVEIDKNYEGSNPQKYEDKLKNLIYKIKNQTLDTDNGIRFGWKNK